MPPTHDDCPHTTFLIAPGVPAAAIRCQDCGRASTDIVADLHNSIAALERALATEREARTRECDFAGAANETAAARIRKLLHDNLRLRAQVERIEADSESCRPLIHALATLPYVEVGGVALPCPWCQQCERHSDRCPVSRAQEWDAAQ